MTVETQIKKAEERLDAALKALKASADQAKARLETLAEEVRQKLG